MFRFLDKLLMIMNIKAVLGLGLPWGVETGSCTAGIGLHCPSTSSVIAVFIHMISYNALINWSQFPTIQQQHFKVMPISCSCISGNICTFDLFIPDYGGKSLPMANRCCPMALIGFLFLRGWRVCARGRSANLSQPC